MTPTAHLVRRVRLTVAGLAAAALLAMPAASLQFGLVMLLALLGYVLVDRGVRRVRWAVAAGIGLLAVVAAMRLRWARRSCSAPTRRSPLPIRTPASRSA
ncbi:hypothetical protein [Micromonospora sp. 4G55]|uniref:hypothetical protein n=1 Tax=Micromonospora sp. 4G55 TaxID=2806102 RepID=UPI001A48AE3D|nr:hypothetical protein [Micromonospora sp. 4G55]MBM0257708.1 hypothetical protein [Micromonospora sp. 4G55]